MTNTLTKARYQGRTYLATLATTGRKVVITVEAGYTATGGEISRLQDIALERYGFEVVVAEIVTPTPAEDRNTPRWWSVEMNRPMTRVEYAWDGSPMCFGDYETDYERVVLACPGLIPAYMGQLAPGWDITDFCESSAQAEDLEPCPF
jgi:hypothetical protein